MTAHIFLICDSVRGHRPRLQQMEGTGTLFCSHQFADKIGGAFVNDRGASVEAGATG